MKVHPVFHISQLESVAVNPMERQVVPPPQPVIFDDEEEYQGNKILNSKTYQHQL